MADHDSTTLVAFKAVCNFVKDLNFAFGDRLPPLQLYAHLLDKTGLINEEPIRKHVAIFQEFVEKNEEAILQQSVSLLQDHYILKYSDKVYINLNAVIQLSEKEDISTLWTHLLTIMAILRPGSCAKDVLRQYRALAVRDAPVEHKEEGEAKQADMNDPFQNIGNIFQTLMSGMANMEGGGSGDANANPLEMLGSLMNSPVIASMVKNLNDGDLDMPKIMDGMQKTLSTLQTVLNQSASNETESPASGGEGN